MRAIELREGHSADEFRREALRSRNAAQVRRLIALAAIRDGKSRTEAARCGGMDRQTLRDWVHAYNDKGIEGLIDAIPPGRPCRLSAAQKEEIRALVEKGPDFEKDGVVRFRRADLKRIVKTRFGVAVDEDTIGRILRELGFSHISPRPQHPGQAAGATDEFKKNSARSSPRP